MKGHYSNLPDAYFDLSPGSKPKYRALSGPSWEEGTANSTRKAPFAAWVKTTWTLVLHGVLSVGVTALVLVYVDGRRFNLTERFPSVRVVGGTRASSFVPMQSDVVTIISSIIVVLKCALAAWTTSLCWRVALFLMERRGIARWDLKALLEYGVLAPGVYKRDWSALVIGALLLASLAANFLSPILTGSISWIPSNQLAPNLSIDQIHFPDIESDVREKQTSSYFGTGYEYVRRGFVFDGAGLAGMAWGRDTEKGALKRASRVVEALAINSTIENVTLPYFEVHSIRWIENADDIPYVRDNGTDATDRKYGSSSPITAGVLSYGYALLVPNVTTNWSSDPMEATTIHDTRLLVLYHRVDIPTGVQILTQSLPESAYIRAETNRRYAFAWVTFSAGVGRCQAHNCIISSQSTIRNNTSIELEPHQLTFQAVSLAPVIGIYLVAQNTSLPSGWDSINDYVEAVLVRSYSGAWNALNSRMTTVSANSTYVPAFPGLLAQVNHMRVYVWLGVQLLVTFLSILFLIIQTSLSQYPLIGDTVLTGFYLDTTDVPRRGSAAVLRGNGILKIEPRGDRMKVKVE